MNTNTVRSNEASVIAASNLDRSLASNSADELIPGTDWTWSEAASMSKEIRREDRLFGNHRPVARRVITAAQRYARKLARFTAQTGWSMADAMDEAIETRRDRRLFGNSHYASV